MIKLKAESNIIIPERRKKQLFPFVKFSFKSDATKMETWETSASISLCPLQSLTTTQLSMNKTALGELYSPCKKFQQHDRTKEMRITAQTREEVGFILPAAPYSLSWHCLAWKLNSLARGWSISVCLCWWHIPVHSKS